MGKPSEVLGFVVFCISDMDLSRLGSRLKRGEYKKHRKCPFLGTVIIKQ